MSATIERHTVQIILVASLAFAAACGGGGDGASAGDAGGATATSGGDSDGAVGVPSLDAALPVDAATTAHDGGSGADASSPEASAPDAGALDPHVAPGGNFDLSVWELQEPIGSPGAPTTIAPAKLAGANGFHDSYFFTDPADGSMTFWDPENGVTTANSSYPRSELREMTASGAPADWSPPGTHTLRATLKVTTVPDHVAVGQIHLGTGTPASTKPLLELFYFATGAIVLGIEQTPAGGNEVQHPVGNVPLGTKWSYVIGLSGNTISLTIDGGATQTFAMSSTFDQENMYFKAGDYDQSVGASATVGAKVQFYALSVFHAP
jgi:hypothetical protein